MYSLVRVSTLMRSPVSTKMGTCTSAPVSSLAGLVTLVAVLPRAWLRVLDPQHHMIRR